MIALETIWDTLRTINDPEMPINLVDLGIVADVRLETSDAEQTNAIIDLTPTFVGCPALHMIEREVRQKVGRLPGVAGVQVNFVYDPPWSVDRISDAGRDALRRFGVTVPQRGERAARARLEKPALVSLGTPLQGGNSEVEPAAVACPFCGSDVTHLESPFGPTRCKMIYYCAACKNSFEHLKRIEVS